MNQQHGSQHTLPICHRNGMSGKLEIIDVDYDGLLEEKTMRRVNKLFLEKAGSGYFYPFEPMDAYHDVWLELERKAAELPELTKASPHTYMSGVARLLFISWFKRKVEPARQMYRQIEDLHRGENERLYEPADLSAHKLGEQLPDISDGKERIAYARQILEAIFERLPEEAVRAFRGYLAADGNFVEAARKAHISKTKFYRLWPMWIRAARAVGERTAI